MQYQEGCPAAPPKAGRRFPAHGRAASRIPTQMSTTSHPAVPANDRAALRRSISTPSKAPPATWWWYDVYVYSVFAVYFESQFFSPDDKNSTLYVGDLRRDLPDAPDWCLVLRPLRRPPWPSPGADGLGHADGTVLVPHRHHPHRRQHRHLVAVILLFARLLQGFATGGEYGASATYMSEVAIPGRRGFLSSFHYVTLVGAMCWPS